jgi:hypothetical protein
MDYKHINLIRKTIFNEIADSSILDPTKVSDQDIIDIIEAHSIHMQIEREENRLTEISSETLIQKAKKRPSRKIKL